MLGNCFNTELFSQPQNETIISFKSSKLSNLAIPISLSFILVSFPFSLPSCLPLSFFSGEGVEKLPVTWLAVGVAPVGNGEGDTASLGQESLGPLSTYS